MVFVGKAGRRPSNQPLLETNHLGVFTRKKTAWASHPKAASRASGSREVHELQLAPPSRAAGTAGAVPGQAEELAQPEPRLRALRSDSIRSSWRPFRPTSTQATLENSHTNS